MESFIFLLALLRTVSHFLASTWELKLSNRATPFTLPLSIRQEMPPLHVIFDLNNKKLALLKLHVSKFCLFLGDSFSHEFDLVLIGHHGCTLFLDVFVDLLQSFRANFPYPQLLITWIPLFTLDCLKELSYRAFLWSLKQMHLQSFHTSSNSINRAQIIMSQRQVSELLQVDRNPFLVT